MRCIRDFESCWKLSKALVGDTKADQNSDLQPIAPTIQKAEGRTNDQTSNMVESANRKQSYRSTGVLLSVDQSRGTVYLWRGTEIK